ncbi:TlyA family RNA methyltransferase [Candidatus Poriferisodalis sp.]|uniref:TlyA family RNA methyltransferase n=1 Tax=Candidatus Poriferisodalis sp. TaxID=3101277 RepID=UPI003B597588
MNTVRRRLDNELVRRAMAPSRAAAQALISGGRVLVSGAVAQKPSRMVAAAEPVQLSGEPARFVSRGGDKLDAALDAFRVEVEGRRAFDAGSSTGGFVDCLLQRGAVQVVAADVGWGQLDARLRTDTRVTVRERCNVRHVEAADIGGAADIVTADLSFISLRTVMANLAACTAPGGDAVLLAKPQFEAGRREASRGKGVIRDPDVWRRVLREVAASASKCGLVPAGVDVSLLRGAAGNVEFFLHCRRAADQPSHVAGASRTAAVFDLDAAIDGAVQRVDRTRDDGGAAR